MSRTNTPNASTLLLLPALAELGACAEAQQWVRVNSHLSPATLWSRANPGHMLWLIAKLSIPYDRAEYERAHDAAWEEYGRGVGAAWAEYDRVVGAALAEYERVRGPAWAEYQRVKGVAREEYERVKGAALASAVPWSVVRRALALAAVEEG